MAKVFIVGAAGKVGTRLTRLLATDGHIVHALHRKPEQADTLAAAGATPVLGDLTALSAEALAPLRGACAGVAQMHPMISFASRTFFPTLTRGHCHVKGDPAAEKRTVGPTNMYCP